MVTAPTRKLQTLQVARGAAALLVLLFHLTYIGQGFLGIDLLKGIFKFGYSGVDFFFVLSGFIIYFAHHEDVGRPSRLRAYLRKRFVRIYPVYWIIALALLPVYFSPVSAQLDFGSYLTTLAKALVLLPQAGNPLVTVAWSLTFEVFFYLMFALAIYFPKRRTRPLVVLWLLLSFISYLDKLGLAGSLSYLSLTRIHVLNFVFSFYNLEFAMGCAVAYLLKHARLRHGGKLALGAAIFFLIGGVLNSLLWQQFVRADGVLLYGLPAALLVWGAASWELRCGVALPALLMLLGDASYSIYLTHYALLDLLTKGCISLGLPAIVGAGGTLGAVFSVTLGLGLIFFVVVERPLLNKLQGRADSASLSHLHAPLAAPPEGQR